MRLSIPRTISMATSVASAAKLAGSEKIATISTSSGSPSRDLWMEQSSSREMELAKAGVAVLR